MPYWIHFVNFGSQTKNLKMRAFSKDGRSNAIVSNSGVIPIPRPNTP